MPDILVRNLSEETVALLKSRAARHKRSVQAEVAGILEREAQRERADEFWSHVNALREMLAGRGPFPDSAELIREDRDSR